MVRWIAARKGIGHFAYLSSLATVTENISAHSGGELHQIGQISGQEMVAKLSWFAPVLPWTADD